MMLLNTVQFTVIIFYNNNIRMEYNRFVPPALLCYDRRSEAFIIISSIDLYFVDASLCRHLARAAVS